MGNRNILGQDLALASGATALGRADQVSLSRTVADWMERLPGVSLNGQGGLLQSYSVRGLSRWRIRTEVDGVPILTDRRAGNSASFLPPELVGRVEVERGPGSTIYGSDAMGGVVELSTIQPEAATLTSHWQTNDNAWAIMAGGAVGEHVSLAAAHRSANLAEDPEGAPLNSGYRQSAARLGIQTAWRGVEVDLKWLESRGRDIGKSSSQYPDSQIAEYPEDDHSLLRFQVSDPGVWLARFYHHGQDWTARTERIGRRTNLTRYQADTLGGLLYAATEALSGTGRAGIEWLGRRGVDIQDQERSADSGETLTTQLVDGSQDGIGVFVDQQWESGQWRVGSGLRWDHISQSNGDRERSDSRGNFNVGLDWLPSESWRLSSRVGTGFRFPTLSELYFNGTTPRGDTLGNPNLAPERSLGFELEAAWSGATLDLRLTAYRNEVTDYIERVRIAPGLRSFRNTEDARINGMEAQLTWLPGERWRHEVSYQWQEGEDDSGRWLADLNPPGLRYYIDWRGERLTASVDVMWRESREDFGPDEMPLDEAFIANGSLSWQWTDQFRGELYASNLFDETYIGSADDEAPLQPGRTLGVRFVWGG